MNSQHPADIAAANARPKVTCDQEVWVKDRIKTAIDMALASRKCMRVGADETILNCAVEGIVNGAAVEIIRTLGMQPEFTNLRDPKTTVTVAAFGSNVSTSWIGGAGDALERKLEEKPKKPYRGPENHQRLARLTQFLKRQWKIKPTTGEIEALANFINA